MGISTTSGYYAIEFYEKFIKKYIDSKDVSLALETSMQQNFIEEGENISWHKICNKYLPTSKEYKPEVESYIECPKCHWRWKL